MSLNFDTLPPPLPVSDELLALLRHETTQADICLEHVTVMTLRFEAPGYSPKRGRFHPVHIRLVRGLDGCFVFRGLTPLCAKSWISICSMASTSCRDGDGCNYPKPAMFSRCGSATSFSTP